MKYVKAQQEEMKEGIKLVKVQILVKNMIKMTKKEAIDKEEVEVEVEAKVINNKIEDKVVVTKEKEE